MFPAIQHENIRNCINVHGTPQLIRRVRSYPGVVEAAFFDLDKTVIARPSMVAFGGTFRREGLISRRLLARALWAQLVYLTLGADEARLARVRDAALKVSKGWEQRRITELVLETLEQVIDPIVYREALDLIAAHRGAGRRVYIVSASPEEIVAPLARHLGADEAVATRAVLDLDGRYTGEVERYCYGPEKVAVILELAERDGLDLSRSYAYSDSATDVPMLEAVGTAVAVNPDRELARVAAERGWEIRQFTHGESMRDHRPRSTVATVGVGAAVAGVAAAGGAAAWVLAERRRVPVPPPLGRREAAYAAITRVVPSSPRLRRG